MVGKNFPLITNLKDSPSYFSKTITLIEKSLGYESSFTFSEDFAPLVAHSNLHNCFIMINENDEVIAHIGVKEKTLKLNEKEFVISLLGGIVVDESQRGQGYFQNLMVDVLSEKRDETTLFLLWSDLDTLYRKFGFFLCGTQFEVSIHEGNQHFEKTKYHFLSENDKKSIQQLYSNSFCKLYLSTERSSTDWALIEKITSSDLYIKRFQGEVSDYFFMNKGQDLQGIIFEYGSSRDIKSLLTEARSYGKIWTGKSFSKDEESQFQFLLAPGDTKLFKSFIFELTKGLIDIRDINAMKQEVYFDFNGELLALSTEEFLRGILGPGEFEEISEELKTIFISGLDSV